ncbi:MAG: hypothetical protein M0R70_12565 [Nitrospirae bacterium]|nr:hypothetical protein [Nitrospirota bacterium]
MAEGDFNKPSSSSTKLGFMTEIREMFATLAKMNGAGANLPTDCVRYNSATKRFEAYNGATWAAIDVTGSSQFVAGTRMLFQQTAAPTGWTKETSAAYNDAALRVVTGSVATGGAAGFSAVFNNTQAVGVSVTVNNHMLTIAEMPTHHHTEQHHGSSASVPQGTGAYFTNPSGLTAYNTSDVGSGNGHTHTNSASGSFTIPNLKYCDIIIATKD